MNSRRQMIKVGIVVLIVVLLEMMLTHCTNTTETKSVKSDKTVEKTKKKVTTKRPGKNKSIDVDKSSSQEEKKEETAKADFSNKSNSSEPKKNNTASTSSNSNKNNSSSSSSKPSSKPSNSSNNSGSSKPSNNSGSNSSSSKPAEHKHEWVAQYKTVNVPEKGHNEQLFVQAAYDEQVPQYHSVERSICNQCGADITNNIDAHFKSSWDCSGYHMELQQVLTGYKTVHHEAVYETRYVVDSPATTKQELTGYKCSVCGKTRAN